ncbi:MAG: sensor histidine kinase [Pleomorphochaeta sp.]
MRSSRDWSNIAFEEYCNRLSSVLSNEIDQVEIQDLVHISLMTATEDNRISGLIFRDEEGKVIYSFGKTPLGEELTQRKSVNEFNIGPPPMMLEEGIIDDSSYKNIKTNSPINLIEVSSLDNKTLVDLIVINEGNGLFDKREIEVPLGVNKDALTGSIIVKDDCGLVYGIDVLVFSPTNYKYSKDIFRQGYIWIISALLIAIIISLILSFYFSKQLENYAKGLKKALNKLSNGEENVTLPYYNVEEYNEINKSVKLLDDNLSQNRKNRKAWLRNITHDLNTPIASMQILLDGIKDKIFPLNDDTISLIKKEQTNLSNRVNRVVLFASLQSPDKEIYISHCNTEDIISSLNKTKMDFERVKFVENDKEIIADFTTIVLALKCLIENALAYSKDEIIVELSKNEIKVINTGSIESNDSIFEPWERGDSSRTDGGNGLGLPIVYEVMKLHNGSINLISENYKVYAIMKWNRDVD